MKPSLILIVVFIMVQQFAMYFFMRIVKLGLFASAGLGVLIALIVYFVLYFVQKCFAARDKNE
ncbi:hypothetical protein [Pedosphaera parvula]|uniref:Uncharacterized protein n=1 Tax=Pedosphaera parvula (strain Ellin514) TaxID=320771 RepID=B9XBD9_PEDPL|nr:hypothetical protein [Pedosphaera parvula]EEF62824.1 hypothetical protein Cflav_PD5459 [Pedosphaera parvula Ellin514]